MNCFQDTYSIKVMAQVKVQIKLEQPVENSTKKLKLRTGRWSRAEINLFQLLLERYGKNWKKIKEHIKYRSLQQIRTHGHNYFYKAGPAQQTKFIQRNIMIQAFDIINKNDKKTEYSKNIKSQQLFNLKYYENRKNQNENMSVVKCKLTQIIKEQHQQEQMPQYSMNGTPIKYENYKLNKEQLTLINYLQAEQVKLQESVKNNTIKTQSLGDHTFSLGDHTFFPK